MADLVVGGTPVYEATPPTGAARGGVIVLQDAFGVTGYLEDVCRRLAAEGYRAVAPKLFHRTGAPVVPFDQIEASRPHITALSGAGVLADVDTCLTRFASVGIAPASVGVVGFCMGGTLGFFLATRRPLGAVVSFYGHVASSGWADVPSMLASWPELDVPWLGLFGDADAMIPIADVEQLRALLAGAPVPTEVVRYVGANHAFHRDVTPDWYHEASARAAWTRTLDWFRTHLSPVEGRATADTAQEHAGAER